MKFRATSYFLAHLENLCKKPKDKYSSCRKDIAKAFPLNQTFGELWMSFDTILDSGNIKIVKVRVPNSEQKIGKSGGFRCICVLDRTTEEIIFLDVYPKQGKLAKDTVKGKELEKVIEKYSVESDAGVVAEIDIYNKCAIVLPVQGADELIPEEEGLALVAFAIPPDDPLQEEEDHKEEE